MKPLVSILMPFHNAGDAFAAALHSILTQTYDNWELLLCDDGSTDASLAVAQSIRDTRVSVWSDGTRKGLAARLNESIDRARGELIARMDADDVSYPERLEKQVAFLMSHPEIDLAGCQVLVFDQHGAPLGVRGLPLDHALIAAHPHLGFGIAHPAWMGRAAWFRKFRYDERAVRYEDAELLYRSHRTSRFANLPEILYGYREAADGFRKRLKTRVGRLRYISTVARRREYIRAGVTEIGKIVSDAVLVSTSRRYAFLRAREQRLSVNEASVWNAVLDSVTHAAPRLMMLTTVSDTMGFFKDYIRVLIGNGIQVHAVSSPGGTIDHSPGLVEHRVSMARRPDPARDVVSIFRLIRLICRIRPNIVHAHTPKAGLLGMAAARLAGVRVRLYTIHGLPLLTRRGIWRRVLALAERTACSLATRVYTVSPSIREVAIEMRLAAAEKIAMLGDGSCAGIDLARFTQSTEIVSRAQALRKAYAVPQDALLVSFVGRIAKDKGIAVLAAAWPEIAREFSNVHLLIAGINDASDPAPAHALNALRDDPRVHFTEGWVTDTPALYTATDIIALPTFREGLPQVALEAGAMSVPVVSTCVPGVISAVRDGVTGLLVPAGEPAPFAAAIRKLVEDPARRASLGAGAREFISARFSADHVNQLWIAEYRRLFGESLPGLVKPLAQMENPGS